MNPLILIWLIIAILIPTHFLLAKWCGDKIKKREFKLLIWFYAFLGIYISVLFIGLLYGMDDVFVVIVCIFCAGGFTKTVYKIGGLIK